MKFYFYVLLLLGFFVASCGNKTAEKQKEIKPDPPAHVQPKVQAEKPAAPSECYSYINKKDTIFLQINEVGSQTKGLLFYKYDQKDENLGTFQGSMVNDLLVAEYIFRSEGVTSSRQVVFKKKGDGFVEGFGEVQEVNGRMIFKDIPSLTYSETMVLKKIPCKQ